MDQSTPIQETLYQYFPLESNQHIRLLSLIPSSKGTTSCQIEHFNLSQPPPYNALSYVWGSSDKPERISCGDLGYIPITASLHEALGNLVLLQDGGRFWIDAICINQEDVAERNHQVTLMGSIYRKASMVITYIGPGNIETYSGMILAQQLAHYYNETSSNPPDPRILQPESFAELGFPPADDSSWRCLRKVVQLPWSSRVWIVQESVLNDNIVMMCGKLMLPWEMLAVMVDLVIKQKLPLQAIFDEDRGIDIATDRLAIMRALRTFARKDGGLNKTLSQLLRNCHFFESTDPRDKVYAMLGIAKDAEELGIVPDYELSVRDVYVGAAVRILEVERSLDLLSDVCGQKSVSLPSWVPDFSFKPPKSSPCLLTHIGLIRQGLYHASNSTAPTIAFDPTSDKLTVTGALFDRISYTSSDFDLLNIDLAWLQANMQKARSLQTYTSEEHLLDSFWRTLLTNVRSRGGVEATPDGRADFLAWVALLVETEEMARVAPGEKVVMPEKGYHMYISFLLDMTSAVVHRCFCFTEKGFLCLAPEGARVGDVVSVLMGGKVCYILRSEDDDKMGGEGGVKGWKLIGEAYVHGLMKGEAMQMEGFEVQPIVLV